MQLISLTLEQYKFLILLSETSDYDRNDVSLNIDQNFTKIVGQHRLYFLAYDRNYNYFRFTYDISVNDIRHHSAKFYTYPSGTTDRKHRLLLRGNNTKPDGSDNNDFIERFVRLGITFMGTSIIPSDIRDSKKLYLYNYFIQGNGNDFQDAINNTIGIYDSGMEDRSSTLDNLAALNIKNPIESVEQAAQFKSNNVKTLYLL